MKNLAKLLRMKHYIKNIIVFVPFAFTGIWDFSKFLLCLVGFISISLASSSIYIINDVRDIEKDRLHPTKKNRPITSGTVSQKTGISIAVLCLVFSAGLVLSLVFLFGVRYSAPCWIMAYFLLNLFYSFGLKNQPIIDILILMSGFLIRILFGAVLADTVVPSWLYLTVMSGAFYFALGKRRNEITGAESVGATRNVLKAYSHNFLDKFMYVSLAMANIFYALWAKEYPKKYMILTVPLVIVICMQYSLDIEGDSDGDPVEVILNDKKLIVFCFVLVALMAAVLFVV